MILCVVAVIEEFLPPLTKGRVGEGSINIRPPLISLLGKEGRNKISSLYNLWYYN